MSIDAKTLAEGRKLDKEFTERGTDGSDTKERFSLWLRINSEDLIGAVENLAVFNRGSADAYQDRCENVPFSSVGGPEKRVQMERPGYITEEAWPMYRSGYEAQCRGLWGDDWQTAKFGWVPALTIGGTDGD